MKCPHCGSQLSIEDAICPFCGRVNKKAKGYTTTMKHYEDELSSAQKKVEKSTHFIKSFVVFLIATVILCVANFILALMNKNVSQIQDYIAAKNIDLHYDECCQLLDTYIEEGEYFTYNDYYNYKHIFVSDRMDSYVALQSYISDYISIFENMLDLVYYDIYEYPPDKEQALSSMSFNIYYFYYRYNDGKDSYSNSDMQENHWEQVNLLNQKLRVLLSYYFSMTEQELNQMSSMSELQLTLFFGRRLGMYE